VTQINNENEAIREEQPASWPRFEPGTSRTTTFGVRKPMHNKIKKMRKWSWHILSYYPNWKDGKENHEEPQLGESQPRFEPGTSRIQARRDSVEPIFMNI
jgi:hypothetical protein